MSGFMLYLFTRLDSFCSLLSGLAVVSIICLFVLSMLYLIFKKLDGRYYDAEEERYVYEWIKVYEKHIKKLLRLVFILVTLKTLIPSSKEASLIYVIPKLSNSEITDKLKKDVPDIYNLAMEAIKEKITDSSKTEKEDK